MRLYVSGQLVGAAPQRSVIPNISLGTLFLNFFFLNIFELLANIYVRYCGPRARRRNRHRNGVKTAGGEIKKRSVPVRRPRTVGLGNRKRDETERRSAAAFV